MQSRITKAVPVPKTIFQKFGDFIYWLHFISLGREVRAQKKARTVEEMMLATTGFPPKATVR
jgi:hypothetical protein